jgi:hypothetical protein
LFILISIVMSIFEILALRLLGVPDAGDPSPRRVRKSPFWLCLLTLAALQAAADSPRAATAAEYRLPSQTMFCSWPSVCP